MGTCAVTIKKRNVRPYGKSALVSIALSSSYATGGDTITRASLGLQNRISSLIANGATTPGGHALEFIPGATEYADYKVRVRDVATGVELANASNNSAQSFLAEAIASPYR